jgi:hypothetical protein
MRFVNIKANVDAGNNACFWDNVEKGISKFDDSLFYLGTKQLLLIATSFDF